MKRVVLNGLTLIFLTFAVCGLAGAQSQPEQQPQSLGDFARVLKRNRAEKARPASSTVYDNDNLPSSTSISVVGDSSASADASNGNKAAANAAQSQNQNEASKVKPGQSAQDREKALDAWKQKIDAQKEKVDQLAKDLDAAKNHPTSTSTVPVWPYNTGYQQDVTDRQKALDDARAELNQMQEDARKEGVPNSVAQ
ncbi:MAG TPA: hypothetical protein VJO35_08505 [Terriglobales bacterium]|nr:hypothetical protein [Terriglobales bacterium]